MKFPWKLLHTSCVAKKYTIYTDQEVHFKWKSFECFLRVNFVWNFPLNFLRCAIGYVLYKFIQISKHIPCHFLVDENSWIHRYMYLCVSWLGPREFNDRGHRPSFCDDCEQWDRCRAACSRNWYANTVNILLNVKHICMWIQ